MQVYVNEKAISAFSSISTIVLSLCFNVLKYSPSGIMIDNWLTRYYTDTNRISDSFQCLASSMAKGQLCRGKRESGASPESIRSL